ncbi:MAG: NAD(P)-dependent methylenetetrahydromethanopterin dehydrogenase [Methylophilaceae bacterium]
MKKASILHLITPAKNASPFDVNMAIDGGFDNIMPYTNVVLGEVTGLVQDAIFSRSPSGIKLEGVFVGGRDIDMAMDMLETAKKAMFPPFQFSLFADPSGAFTTAAAMLAKVEFHLKKHFNEDLQGKKIAIFGATGPVGSCVAVIAAKQGAEVLMVAHRALGLVKAKVDGYNQRYNTNLQCVDGATEASKQAVLAEVDVALCCAAAGMRVLTLTQISSAQNLKVVADVNAVSPTGAEGVEVNADAVLIEGTKVLGIGALAVGNLKYATQHNLLKQMLADEKPSYLEFMAAFSMAQTLVQTK